MNRIVTCMLAGAAALWLAPAALAQDEAPADAADSKPVPLTEVDPAQYMDLLAESKDGDVLGVVYDVVLDDAGNARTVVLELFEETPEGSEEGEIPEGEVDAQDQVEDEPEPLPEEGEAAGGAEAEGTEAEGTEEPVIIGTLVAVSPKGGIMDPGRDVVVLPAVQAGQLRELPEFDYEEGMKTVGHPEGYKPEE